MTLQEAAQIYIDLVELEKSLEPDQRQARQEVNVLRSKYHDIFTRVLRENGIQCADRFEATAHALELVALDNFSEVADNLSRRLAPISQGLEKVIKEINTAVTNRNIESLRDHLALLRVADVFNSHVYAVEFERSCSYQNCSRTHDVILRSRRRGVSELVIEVARVNEKKLDGDVIEEQHTEKIDITRPKVSLGPFKEVCLLKDNTSVLKETADLIVRKSRQLCPGQQNMIWIVSQNFLFDHVDIEDAVWFLCGGHRQRPEDQRALDYSPPEHLAGVGWLHEPSITSAQPHFFPMVNDQNTLAFIRQYDVVVKELSVVKRQD